MTEGKKGKKRGGNGLHFWNILTVSLTLMLSEKTNALTQERISHVGEKEKREENQRSPISVREYYVLLVCARVGGVPDMRGRKRGETEFGSKTQLATLSSFYHIPIQEIRVVYFFQVFEGGRGGGTKEKEKLKYRESFCPYLSPSQIPEQRFGLLTKGRKGGRILH